MKRKNNTAREFSKHQASKKNFHNHAVNPSAKPSRGLSTKALARMAASDNWNLRPQ